MSAVLVLIAGFVLAAAAALWSSSGVAGSSRVAVVAVIGVTAAAFNVIVPVPSVEATTTVVLCGAIALGARTAVAIGIVAIVGSSVTGGIGVWTLWQVVAVVVVALLGAAVGLAARDRDWFTRSGAIALGLAAMCATLSWDIITTAGSVLSIAPSVGVTPLQQLLSFLLLGLMFTATHVVFSTVFTIVGGPPLLHALHRARTRLDGGAVLGAGAVPDDPLHPKRSLVRD